jgi:hypothetical protein
MYRRHFLTLLLLLSAARIASAQAALNDAPPPQSARQALVEMLRATTPDAFVKHLPVSTVAILKKDTSTLPLRGFVGIVSELHREGQKIETFQTGPVLVRARNPGAEETMELTVESDLEGGDEDELQLAVHTYRAGRLAPLPFVPTLTRKMKMDQRTWRLDEVVVNLRVPIGDADFLEDLGNRMSREEFENREWAALHRLRELSTAETSYVAAFPSLGFTCVLSDLGGTGAGAPSTHAARMIENLRSSKEAWIGYRFSASDCTGGPVNHFQIVAETLDTEPGLRAFCIDQSALVRYSEDGQGSSCLRAGETLP